MTSPVTKRRVRVKNKIRTMVTPGLGANNGQPLFKPQVPSMGLVSSIRPGTAMRVHGVRVPMDGGASVTVTVVQGGTTAAVSPPYYTVEQARALTTYVTRASITTPAGAQAERTILFPAPVDLAANTWYYFHFTPTTVGVTGAQSMYIGYRQYQWPQSTATASTNYLDYYMRTETGSVSNLDNTVVVGLSLVLEAPQVIESAPLFAGTPYVGAVSQFYRVPVKSTEVRTIKGVRLYLKPSASYNVSVHLNLSGDFHDQPSGYPTPGTLASGAASGTTPATAGAHAVDVMFASETVMHPGNPDYALVIKTKNSPVTEADKVLLEAARPTSGLVTAPGFSLYAVNSGYPTKVSATATGLWQSWGATVAAALL